eukprot:273631-Amphidinium_carterae.1
MFWGIARPARHQPALRPWECFQSQCRDLERPNRCHVPVSSLVPKPRTVALRPKLWFDKTPSRTQLKMVAWDLQVLNTCFATSKSSHTFIRHSAWLDTALPLPHIGWMFKPLDNSNCWFNP